MNQSNSRRVAVVWHGDRQARAEARPETCRLNAVFAALERVRLRAEPAIWSEERLHG